MKTSSVYLEAAENARISCTEVSVGEVHTWEGKGSALGPPFMVVGKAYRETVECNEGIWCRRRIAESNLKLLQ